MGTLYSCDNVWANIQLSGHPWDISWALPDASCWRPFFGPVLPAREMACIQVRTWQQHQEEEALYWQLAC